MTALIRSELVGLRTLRSTYGVALTAVLLAVGLTWGDIADRKTLVTDEQLYGAIVTGAGITIALVGVLLAAARVAGEYRYGTIANRALAAPRRSQLFGSKVTTYAGLGLLGGLVLVGVGIVTAVPVLDSEGGSLSMGGADALEVVARVVVAGTLFTALGAIVGFITRSQQAAVTIIFGTFFAEKIVGGMISGSEQYLPFGMLNGLLDTTLDHPVRSGVLLTVFTAGLAAFAAGLVNQRDVQS